MLETVTGIWCEIGINYEPFNLMSIACKQATGYPLGQPVADPIYPKGYVWVLGSTNPIR
jgi:hypothetical protein